MAVRSKNVNTNKLLNANLEYLGQDFQNKLVKVFLEDGKFFIRMNRIVDQNMFTHDMLRRIVGYMKDRYHKTGLAPTYEDLELHIRTQITDMITLDSIIATLNSLKDLNLVGLDIVYSESDKFFKQQNLTKAINKAMDIITEGDSSRYSEIEDLVRKALETNADDIEGYNPMDGIEEALKDDYREAIPTGFERLDKALYGGLGRGELGIIIAPSNVGKSSAVCGFAAAAATCKCAANNYKGYNVMHLHFEDEDVNIKRKYYGYLTDIDAIELCERREEALNILYNEQDGCNPKLIKENVWCLHPVSGEMTVDGVRQLIMKAIARGKRPDMVIIDYFECLKLEAGTKNDTEWTREGLTMRKLEALAHEFNIALWVPIQGTKSSFDKDIVGLSEGGGSVKKVQIGHVIITMARNQKMKRDGKINIYLQKFRAGRMTDNEMLNIDFNNGTCKFSSEESDDEIDYVAEFEENEKRRFEDISASVVKGVKQSRKRVS